MNILAFDTSLNKTYIMLSKNDEIISSIFETNEKNYHSAYLITGIKNIIENNSLKLSDINLIAVNNGPGSFTGIRVGVTVAKTMAKELNIPVICVSSLDILCKTYQNFCPDVVLDARREMFYFQGDNDIKLVPYTDVQNLITKNTIICDASSVQHLNFNDKNIINYENDDTNLGIALLELAKEKYSANAEVFWYDLKPRYIQAPPIHKK